MIHKVERDHLIHYIIIIISIIQMIYEYDQDNDLIHFNIASMTESSIACAKSPAQ